MKSYMNTIAENTLVALIIDVREKAVDLKRKARKSFAVGWKERDTTPTLRFNPSAVIDGVNVFLHHDTMRVWTFDVVGIVSMLVSDPATGLARENVLDIHYDSAFAKLPIEIQSAMIAHEVGHYKMGHNQKALDGYCPDNAEAFEWEVQADAYAQDKEYAMAHALQYLMITYRKSLRFKELKQLRQRILRLNNGTTWDIQSTPLKGIDAAYDILKRAPCDPDVTRGNVGKVNITEIKS